MTFPALKGPLGSGAVGCYQLVEFELDKDVV